MFTLPPTNSIELDKESILQLRNSITETWHTRAKIDGIKEGANKARLEAQAHYFTGVMAGLVAMGLKHGDAMPPSWVIPICQGNLITAKEN